MITDLFPVFWATPWRNDPWLWGLGVLAQNRRRFLLVARIKAKYRPTPMNHKKATRIKFPKRFISAPGRRCRSSWPWCTESPPALENLGSISLVEAGSDWRCLNQLRVENGVLKDFYLTCGVNKGLAGRLNIADPGFRVSQKWERGKHSELEVGAIPAAITCQRSPGQGVFSVADPGTGYSNNTHTNIYRVIKFNESCKTITGAKPCHGWQGAWHPRGNGSAVQYQNRVWVPLHPIDFWRLRWRNATCG